jgi:lauroyl/myristoyl acyltransferase
VIAYLLVQFATWLARVLPLGAQLWAADTIAAVGWRVLPAMHGRVRENVRVILGPTASEREVDQVARQQWRNYLRYMRDFAALPHTSIAEIDGVLPAAEGWWHIDEAMSQGRGLVLVSAHLGNWDLAGGAMAQLHPVNVIADSFGSAKMDEAVNERRKALGIKVIPIDKAFKRTVSALRRNEAVAFLVDKPVAGDSGVEVPFLGMPARIPAGAALFASRVGAPLIAAFVWRNPDRSFSARAFPPVPLDGGLAAIMERVMAQVGEVIRDHPEQWYMFRRMWQTNEESLAASGDEAGTETPGKTQMEEAVA